MLGKDVPVEFSDADPYGAAPTICRSGVVAEKVAIHAALSLLPESLPRAEEIGLDMGEFISSFKNRHLLNKITSDFESGIHSGVIGTPAFFINGLMYNGFDDFNSLYKVCRFATEFCKVA